MNLEQLVSETLQERTDRTTYEAPRHADVVHRAAAIRSRRRRRVVAAAAAAAVVVPLAVVGLSHDRASEGAPAKRGVTRTPGHHRISGANPVPSFAEIPRGRAPEVPYIAGDTYVTPSGTRTLPKGTGLGAEWVVPLGDALLIHAAAGGTSTGAPRASDLHLVQGSTVTSLGCASPYVATNADLSKAAYWVSTTCAWDPHRGTLYVADTATGQRTRYAVTGQDLGGVDPVGMIGDGVVANVGRDLHRRVVVFDGSGRPRTIPHLVDAEGVDSVHGVIAGTSDTHRHVMVDAATGVVRWSQPPNGWGLFTISPDGRYVFAGRQAGAASEYALLDVLTGDVVAQIHPAGPHDFDAYAEMRSMTWDHDSFLSNVIVNRRNALLLSSPSGLTTLATGPGPYDREQNVDPPPPYYGLSAP